MNVAAFEAAFAKRIGDVGQAIRAGRRAVAWYADETDPRRALANLNLAEALWYAGELDEAAVLLEDALRALTGKGLPVGLIAGTSTLALVLADAGDADASERNAAEAERLLHELGTPVPLATMTVHSARGRLGELRGDLAGAESEYAGALLVARRRAWPLALADVLLRMARLKRRLRDHDAARALAREARGILATCPDPGVLGELLARTERSLQLGRPPSAAPMPADLELSERELTILRLLASELSQREIGSELYISLNTVKGHVRSIFRKLGVTARADAVARAREFGLI
jgi:LuxR family maltose regulon positive regulatory protein